MPHLYPWPLVLHRAEQCLIIVGVMSTLLPHRPSKTSDRDAPRDAVSLVRHATMCRAQQTSKQERPLIHCSEMNRPGQQHTGQVAFMKRGAVQLMHLGPRA